MLGLGWAATPAELKAMEELAKLEEERGNPAYFETDSVQRKQPGANRGGRPGTAGGRSCSKEYRQRHAAYV